MSKSWTVELEEDGVLPLPDELLDEMGLGEGDEIEWVDRGDGSWEIRRVKEDSPPRSRIESRRPAKTTGGEPLLRLTVEQIRTVYQAVQYLDDGDGGVDFYVDNSNGIGPVITVKYQGEIDLTDVASW
jgi:bifunctional DNA-binding transcriptional regulator/antitoxin component of YhaV-PrlF toxin-antitoxin module